MANLIIMLSKIKKFLPVSIKTKIRHFLDKLQTYKRYKAISLVLKIPEAIMGRFITFHTRPKYAKDVSIDPTIAARDYSEYAIVVQGPILKKNNFTIETLLLYRKYFPNASIILSTGEWEDTSYLNEARKAGVEVLCHTKLSNTGPTNDGRPFNINLQLTSSKAGTHRAAEMNKRYVLKTRTDQRMYNQEILTLLSNLIRVFPITEPNVTQRGRIVGMSANNSKTKPYLFPDQMVFGYTEDMLTFFDADLVPSDGTINFLDSSFPFIAEVYLFSEFLKNIGYKIEYTYEDYFRALAKRCILVDTGSLEWYYCKYGSFREYKNRSYKNDKYNHVSIGFSEWLNLYSLYDK